MLQSTANRVEASTYWCLLLGYKHQLNFGHSSEGKPYYRLGVLTPCLKLTTSLNLYLVLHGGYDCAQMKNVAMKVE